jgi:hypothetical protein
MKKKPIPPRNRVFIDDAIEIPFKDYKEKSLFRIIFEKIFIKSRPCCFKMFPTNYVDIAENDCYSCQFAQECLNETKKLNGT